jgi:hypothetical protein
MKRYTYIIIFFAVGLGLALLAGVIPPAQALAQEDSPNEPQVQQASVSTAITYQGRLEKDGSPINGNCDFIFILYDAETDGNIKGNQNKTATITDGYFSVPLDFGAEAFNGEARWLGIGVRCPSGSGDYSQLSDRTLLTAAPYAQSLRPGAIVSGDTNSNIISAKNANSLGTGILGQAVSASGKTAFGAGVWGDSASRAGVVGTSNSAAGVFGQSTSNAGVSGYSNTSHGLYGSSTSGYALYADGPAYVKGNFWVHEKAQVGDISWNAKTGYISVPAVAFRPYNDNLSYMNSGDSLIGLDDLSIFYAPVQLPHGSTVTQVTWYWYDPLDPENSECSMLVSTLDGNQEFMSQIYTEGSAGNGSNSDDTISYAVIDNSQYAYYLNWTVRYDSDESDGTILYGVIIEYTYTTTY